MNRIAIALHVVCLVVPAVWAQPAHAAKSGFPATNITPIATVLDPTTAAAR